MTIGFFDPATVGKLTSGGLAATIRGATTGAGFAVLTDGGTITGGMAATVIAGGFSTPMVGALTVCTTNGAIFTGVIATTTRGVPVVRGGLAVSVAQKAARKIAHAKTFRRFGDMDGKAPAIFAEVSRLAGLDRVERRG